ncbi:hypothetical protein ISU02_23485 [Fusibacter sp. Q10-2]|uniref:Uncharacterized protein n=1 Tax=Fusibacter ferrireducens TaxID=2785058 RepID=A0ABS0A043_9FIRM|nr:hypothetical protein [Fusibacter ferrireducens]
MEDRNVGDGESITHEYIKEMISELHELNFIVNDKDIRIFVKEAYTEYRIDTDSNQYIVDIFVEFEKSEPFYYFEKWLGILAIEIYVSHKTEYQKKIDLKKIGVPIAEVSIPSSWDLEQYYGDENLFNKKISEMKKMFENKIYAQLISDPESDYYRVKKENIYLKDEIKKLKIKLEEKEINSTNDKKTLMSQIDGLKSEKILLNQKIENSKTEFESLRSEKESIESKLIINKIKSIFKWNK